jgi:hypothetical protein
MSPLLSADDWSLHVCDQQIRGSSSCHFKYTMSWHLQVTRCTFARRRASAWVGSSMESDIDCGRLATTRVRPASPRQQQLPFQVHDGLALTVHAVYAWPKASKRVGRLKYESIIDCRRLATPRVRPTSPGATRHEAGQDLRNSTSARGAVDAARAPMRSSLLAVDGWQLCGGRKIRDSNSCHAQCTMSTCGLKKHAFYCERLASSMCMPFHVRDELAYDLSK